MSAGRRFYAFLLCTTAGLLFSGTAAFGQARAWETVNKSISGVKEKGTKKVSAFRRWRDHLEKWGLDTTYLHSLALSGRLTTSGWAAGAIYRQKRDNLTHSLIALNFSEVKHEKEVSQKRENMAYPEFGPATPFIFGKINNLYLLQAGYGRERTLLPKVLDGSVSVAFRYGGGLSLAMLKPYYLRLLRVDNGTVPPLSIQTVESHDALNSEVFLNTNSILGKAKWKDGLDEMKYVPGAYVEVAFTLENAKSKAFVKTITVGGNAGIYTRKLPLMAQQKAYSRQGCLWVGIEFGKRWR